LSCVPEHLLYILTLLLLLTILLKRSTANCRNFTGTAFLRPMNTSRDKQKIKTMKRLLFLLAFVVVFFNSCQDEDQISNTQVRFSLAIAKGTTETTTDFPNEFSARMTLQSTNGKTIVTNVSFTKDGDTYFSKEVTLPPGQYAVNEVISENDNLAGIALLQDVVIGNNALRTVEVGHAALQAKGANPLLIAVYTEKDGKKKLTDAVVSIYNDQGESFQYNLLPKTNNIAFQGDPEATYEIEISKEGYITYRETFIYNQLSKKRLEITLREKVILPGPAVTFQPSATCFSMWLQFTGTGTVVLDWGNDDEPEVIDFDVDPEDLTGTAWRMRDQCYVTSIPPARITGDIDLLISMVFEADVDALNVYYATNLQELSFNEADLPVLDLSLNHELRWLAFNLTSIGQLTLPQDHAIKFLSITPGYDGWPSVSQLDYIINNIYVNAVAGSRYDGFISLGGATVSEQSAANLTQLQNAYNWEIRY
jgi:hypothetical protein